MVGLKFAVYAFWTAVGAVQPARATVFPLLRRDWLFDSGYLHLGFIVDGRRPKPLIRSGRQTPQKRWFY